MKNTSRLYLKKEKIEKNQLIKQHNYNYDMNNCDFVTLTISHQRQMAHDMRTHNISPVSASLLPHKWAIKVGLLVKMTIFMQLL